MDLAKRGRASRLDHAKSNLCELAIRTFLRWSKDWRKQEQRGITYPSDWRKTFKITTRDGEPVSQILLFITNATQTFYKEIPEWNFDAEHYAKLHKSIRNKSDIDLDFPVVKRE